jgi:Cu(I)-responsive transcriptional regulator
MNIGDAAKRTGVSAKMIRHYEAIGLVGPAARSPAGYRRYTAADLHNLRFIRQARRLGFSIDEIARLLALWQDRARSSGEVKALARRHIADLAQRIAELQSMVNLLAGLVRNCHGDDRPECPILDALEHGVGAPDTPAPAGRTRS